MKLFVAAAALVAISSGVHAADLGGVAPAGAVPSASAVSGDLAIYGGGDSLTDFYDSDYSLSGWLAGAAGRVNIPLSPAISAQLDVSGEHLSDTLGYDYGVFDAAGHLDWRNDAYILGGFVSLGTTDNSDMGGTFVTGGVEGQVDLGQAVLSAQAGVTRSISTMDPDYDVTAPYVRGEVRYFLTPNLAIAANAGAVHETYDDPSEPLDVATFGADIEYRFDNSPISLFASYQGSFATEDPAESGETWVDHAIMAGVKFNFGSDTLQQAAQSGAAQRDYNPITGVQHVRYNNWE